VSALQKTLAIIAFLILVSQTVRHAYLLWLEPRSSVLDKYDQPLKSEITSAASLAELVSRYDPVRKQTDAARAELSKNGKTLTYGDEKELEPYKSEHALRDAITEWETKAKELREASWDTLRDLVYKDRGATEALIRRVEAAGARALMLTVDTPVLGRRERDFRTGFHVPSEILVPMAGHGAVTPLETSMLLSASVTWRDVEQLASDFGLPVVLKGVQTGEDAQLACEHGAAAIVVSNHGGRQLDRVAATIDVLEEVVDAVDGRLEVLIDGGIRRGVDVVTALALGARAALIGRPAAWALAVGGEAGARHMLELLRAEVELALRLVGCTSATDVPRDRVARR